MFASSLIKVKCRDISRLIRRVSAKPGEEILSKGSFVPETLQHHNRGRGGTGPPLGVLLDALPLSDDCRTPLRCREVVGSIDLSTARSRNSNFGVRVELSAQR